MLLAECRDAPALKESWALVWRGAAARVAPTLRCSIVIRRWAGRQRGDARQWEHWVSAASGETSQAEPPQSSLGSVNYPSMEWQNCLPRPVAAGLQAHCYGPAQALESKRKFLEAQLWSQRDYLP